MPLELKPASPLPPFTFSPPSPSAPSEDPPPAPRPPSDFLPDRDMHMFGSQPLAHGEAGRGLIRCIRCGRVNQESAVAEHKRICAHVLDGSPLAAKKGKPVETKKRRASEVISNDSGSPSKKRTKLPETLRDDMPLAVSTKGMKKAEIRKMQKEMQKAEKKAAKEQEKLAIAERKRQRASNPLDFDRQCGVINDKGLPCSRSLTCKTHTVGAKRAVEGRTRPYDILHLEWQRANNPNFKEPATKKEKDAKRAEKIQARLLTNPKKKPGSGEYEEDDLDSEEARRELSDLIAISKMAGSRVSTGRVGAWWGISGIGMGGVGRVGGMWRAATWEFAQVGEMFTKALAVRKPPVQPDRPLQKTAGVPPPKSKDPQLQLQMPPNPLQSSNPGQMSQTNTAIGSQMAGNMSMAAAGNNVITGLNAMQGVNLTGLPPGMNINIAAMQQNAQAMQAQLMAMQGLAGRMQMQQTGQHVGDGTQQFPVAV